VPTRVSCYDLKMCSGSPQANHREQEAERRDDRPTMARTLLMNN